MKRLLPLGLLLCSIPASADWYFRGSPNNWNTTQMLQVGPTIYETCQNFGSGTAAFKIDRLADWSQSFPSANYTVANNSSYKISFDTVSNSIFVDPVDHCFASNLASLHFRGTPNSWGALPMHLVADNTWELNVHFDGKSQQRYKFDTEGDWSSNFGDNGANGSLEASGADIYTSIKGNYNVRVNDATMTYSVTKAVGSLGAVYDSAHTTFSIWSPDSSNVKVKLNGTTYSLSPTANFNNYDDIYQVTVPGNHHLKTYEFYINNKSVRDPYGKMVIPNTNTNIVMDMTKTSLNGGWSATPELAEREDAIVYEVHVRDFTIDSSSGVTANKRGKFLGMVESGSTYQGVKTGIDHLKELGVTHVQLLPVYDFSTCSDPADETCYNWGYDPRNYNIPEDRYSQTPYDYVNRVKEFKTMIDEFHKAGIRVVMDVVYNHTYGDEMFEDITGKYFYEQNLVVGNTIDANQPMVRRMIQDSLEYWVREYNIDGFRFDLIGVFDYDDVAVWGRHINQMFPERNILMYGEPWLGCFGCNDYREQHRVRLGTIGRIQDSHVGVFNPKYREAIKGANDTGGCNSGDCYAFNQGDTWPITAGSRAAIRSTKNAEIVIDSWDAMFAMDPEQSINYVSAHDNLSLRDKIIEWAHANGVAESSTYLRRIQQFSNGIVLTSQGISFLHGGVEIMRDKQGAHNSYNLPDSINKYRWQWKVDNADIFNYYKDVIALRNAHPALRLNTWEEIQNHVTTSTPRYGVVVNHIKGRPNNDSWSEIIVIYNSSNNYNFSLPSGTWKVAMEKSDPTQGNGRNVSGSITAEGTAVTVLYKQ